ncbi:MAG: hypothetical protein V1646_02580 [bacterium]
MKKILLFFALWFGVACAMQPDAIPVVDVAYKATAQELVTSDIIQQHAPDAKQPDSVCTVTVKQIGEPSLKTFYKVPVEITVTNNLDRMIYLVPPYFTEVSFTESGSFLTAITQDIKRIAVAETKLAVGLVCVLGCGATFFIPLYLANGWPLFDLAQVPMYLLAGVGAWSQPAIFISNLISRNLLSTENITWILTPHNPARVNGYISSIDMKKIQDGQLTPKVLMKHEDFFTK